MIHPGRLDRSPGNLARAQQDEHLEASQVNADGIDVRRLLTAVA